MYMASRPGSWKVALQSRFSWTFLPLQYAKVLSCAQTFSTSYLYKSGSFPSELFLPCDLLTRNLSRSNPSCSRVSSNQTKLFSVFCLESLEINCLEGTEEQTIRFSFISLDPRTQVYQYAHYVGGGKKTIVMCEITILLMAGVGRERTGLCEGASPIRPVFTQRDWIREMN